MAWFGSAKISLRMVHIQATPAGRKWRNNFSGFSEPIRQHGPGFFAERAHQPNKGLCEGGGEFYNARFEATNPPLPLRGGDLRLTRLHSVPLLEGVQGWVGS